MKSLKSFLNNIVVQNILFWTISFVVLLRLFTRTEEIRIIDIIYTSLFHIPLFIGVTYNQFALHKFLDAKKFLLFWLSFILSIIFIIQAYPLTFDLFASLIFPDFYFVTVYEWYEMLGIGFIYIGFTTLLHLAKGWFQQQEAITKLAMLEEEQRRSELQVLRAQINPHFLFNTMNSIYGEALKKTDKAPKLVLKLSNILRYIVDNLNQNKVLLEQDLEYIQEYISLQKERLSDTHAINFSVTGNFHELEIAPLILITFIENCFTHGDISQEKPLHISLTVSDGALSLTTKNYVKDTSQTPERVSGMGIENSVRRLDLLYADRYSITHNLDEDLKIFHANVTIQLR